MEYSNYLETVNCSNFKKVIEVKRIIASDKEIIKDFVESLIKAMVNPDYDYDGEEYKSYRAVGFISNHEKKSELLELNYYPDTNTIHSTEFSIHIDGDSRSLCYNDNEKNLQYVYYNKDEFILMNYNFLYENNFFQISHQHYDKNITFDLKSMKHLILDIENKADYEKPFILENKYIMKESGLNFKVEFDCLSIIEPDRYAYRNYKDIFSTFKNVFFKNDKLNEILINEEELKKFFKTINEKHDIDFSDISINGIISAKQYNNFINEIKEKLEFYSLLDDNKVDISLLSIQEIEDVYKEVRKYEKLTNNIFSLTKPIEEPLYEINNKSFMNGMFVTSYSTENLPDARFPKISTDTISTFIETINMKQTLNEISNLITNNELTADKELKTKNKMEL